MPTLVRRTPVRLRLGPALDIAVSEVFESMAFVEAFHRPDNPPFAPRGPVFSSRLPVYRPHAAVVGLIVPRGLAVTIAAAMLGRPLDAETDEFLVMDVLGELANMLAGALLNQLLPVADGFELGLPEVRLVGDLATEPAAPPETSFQFTAHGTAFQVTWEGSCEEE